MTRAIAVYLDWEAMADPLRLGTLHARTGASREVFDLELDPTVLARPELAQLHLDPGIAMVTGHQYPPANHAQFGVFSDASPDRWGRMLMQRRLERDKRARRVPTNRRLLESDYLLGVHDTYRVGALRLRQRDTGPFLDDRHDVAAPLFVKLRELEAQMAGNAALKALMRAQADYIDVMNRVNQAMDAPLTNLFQPEKPA